MGSASITALPTITARAVSAIGRNRTRTASSTAAASGMPSISFSSAKSTRMMLLRTTIPAPAMKPIMLVGILPAHALMGAFFTATSMIGFIAGAGIIVRNSIILVDFVELRLAQGMPLAEAVVDAGAVRFRPMALTAAAVIVGSAVILFDPIFQGLAISLMAGEVASLLLSRMTVPVLYYLIRHRAETHAAAPARL